MIWAPMNVVCVRESVELNPVCESNSSALLRGCVRDQKEDSRNDFKRRHLYKVFDRGRSHAKILFNISTGKSLCAQVPNVFRACFSSKEDLP